VRVLNVCYVDSWQVRIGEDVFLDVPLINKARQNTAECLNGQNYCFAGQRVGQVRTHLQIWVHFGIVEQVAS
jgi:hypothetical protein